LNIEHHPAFGIAAPAEWRARIDAAASPAAVVTLCIEFLSGRTPQECADLPAALQPPLLMSHAADVTDYAFRLVQGECGSGAITPELHAMAAFFAAASTRLSLLLAHPRPGRPAK